MDDRYAGAARSSLASEAGGNEPVVGYRGVRSNLLLLIVSSCVGLVSAEGLARLLIPVRNVGRSFSIYDPFLGKIHKKKFTTKRRCPEFIMTFTSNSEGFRGPERVHGFLDNGLTVLCVGDSYTEGYGVNDGEDFPSLLRERLGNEFGRQRFDIINAGVGDTGTGRAVRFLREWKADAAHPVILVHQFSPNDYRDNLHEGIFSLSPAGDLVETTGDLPASRIRKLQGVIEGIPGLAESYLFSAALESWKPWNRWRKAPEAGGEMTDGDGEMLTYRLLSELLRIAETRKWRVILIEFGLKRRQSEEIEALGSKGGATVLRIPSKAERPDLYYSQDAHWNKRGHAYVAAHVLIPVRKEIEGALSLRRTGN